MNSKLVWFNKSGGTEIFNIKDGLTYVDNLSEELDSATVVLQFVDKCDFESFDLVEIQYQTGERKTMLINDFIENIVSFNPLKYEYTINLMSKTKELERTILPNISITKIKNGTSKDLGVVIDELLEDYSPKILLNNTFEQKYRLAQRPIGLCPDMQMTKPTLRNTIDIVLSTKNSICYLDEDNYVNFIDINERHNEINVDYHYNYQPGNESANDYATELENNYNNVVPNDIEGINNQSIVTEFIGFRNYDEVILDDNNIKLVTKNQIYDLVSVKVCGRIDIDYTGNGYEFTLQMIYNGQTYYVDLEPSGYYFEIDITDSIVESQDYNIKDYETKKGLAYYTRGSNTIDAVLYNKISVFERYIVLINMITNSINKNPSNFFYTGNIKQQFINQIPNFDETLVESIKFGTRQTLSGADFSEKQITNRELFFNDTNAYTLSNSLRNTSMFKITYQAQVENLRSKTGKYLRERNSNNVINDNPSEAYVDIKQQGDLFRQKVNRLGNRAKHLIGRFAIDEYNKIPQLGDYIGDFVLMHRELQYYDNFILFNGVLTENFVNINYFTGINARKRSWNVVSQGEAFDKQLLDKWFCEFNFEQITDKADQTYELTYLADNLLAYNLMTAITGKTDGVFIKHVFIKNQYTGTGDYTWVELDLSSYISGNSLLFNFSCYDNYSIGFAFKEDQTGVVGGTAQTFVKYVDDNGFNNTYNVVLVNSEFPEGWRWETFLNNGDKVVSGQASGDSYNIMKYASGRKPRIRITANDELDFKQTYCNYVTTINNHKDSREKIGFNIQFEFCSANKNIIIGEAFMKRLKFISFYSNLGYKIYTSDKTYKITETSFKQGILDNNATITINKNNQLTCSCDITLTNTDFNSIAICDNSNKLILAINTTSQSLKLWLNLIRTRDRRIFTNRNLKNWN